MAVNDNIKFMLDIWEFMDHNASMAIMEFIKMPTAEISDLTQTRLQAIAIPLEDTHDTVISRLLDHWEAMKSKAPRIVKPGEPKNILEDGTMEFDPANPPPLGFTTCTQIIIAGDQLSRGDTYWNTMMYQMIRTVKKTTGFDAQTIYSMLSIANAEVGQKEDNGYKFLPDVGLSVQGQDSNAAFRQTYQLAMFSGIKFSVLFNWQNNEKAVYPNRRGYMEL